MAKRNVIGVELTRFDGFAEHARIVSLICPRIIGNRHPRAARPYCKTPRRHILIVAAKTADIWREEHWRDITPPFVLRKTEVTP